MENSIAHLLSHPCTKLIKYYNIFLNIIRQSICFTPDQKNDSIVPKFIILLHKLVIWRDKSVGLTGPIALVKQTPVVIVSQLLFIIDFFPCRKNPHPLPAIHTIHPAFLHRSFIREHGPFTPLGNIIHKEIIPKVTHLSNTEVFDRFTRSRAARTHCHITNGKSTTEKQNWQLVCGWDLAECWWGLAKVATVLGSITASSDAVESEGRQMKQCWM